MLADVLARTRLSIPAGCPNMYSMASHPPHDWPSR
jgi:hypothetical protein